MSQVILFDLDGTLTASGEGITKCVQYALDKMGIVENDLKRLECFIGPPLKDSFMKYGDLTEEQAVEAIVHYRERYERLGMFENSLYPKIPDLLELLQINNKIMAVASSKPEKYVKQILEHFDIASYFQEIVGSEMDGQRVTKAEVIEEALVRLGMQTERDKVIMVGDRAEDVLGAMNCGIQCVGAVYGYGTEEELKQAGAVYLAETVEDLAVLASPNDEETTEHVESIRQFDMKDTEEVVTEQLLSQQLSEEERKAQELRLQESLYQEYVAQGTISREYDAQKHAAEEKKVAEHARKEIAAEINAILAEKFPDNEEFKQNAMEEVPRRRRRAPRTEKMSPFHHMWRWIYPLLLYVAVSVGVTLSTGIYFAIKFLTGSESYTTEMLMDKISNTTIEQTMITGVLMTAIAWFFYRIDQKKREVGLLGKGKDKPWCPAIAWIVVVVVSITGCQFLNDVINLLNLHELFPAYSDAATSILGTTSEIVILLTVVVIAPIAEEFIFRGLLFRRMKDWLKPWLAVVLSAFLFGVYHGNMVQFIYAFFMGIVFALIYHRTGLLWTCILAHMIANFWSGFYSVLAIGLADVPYSEWIVLGVSGVLFFLCILWLLRGKRDGNESAEHQE